MGNTEMMELDTAALASSSKKNALSNLACALIAVCMVCAIASFASTTAYASDLKDAITDGANEIYGLVRDVATPIAGTSVVIALFTSFFTHNQRALDLTRQIAKGIVITWAVIMMIGPIFEFGSSIINKAGGGSDSAPTFTTNGGATSGSTT